MSAPFTLVMETATPHASLGLAGADGGFAGQEFSSDRNHNARLFEPLARVLDGVEPSGIERVLVGSGPGSYSGTRVGIAAAQGVALAAGCQAVAVPSLLGVPAIGEGLAEVECLFLGDARRGSYWTARSRGWALVAEPELVDAVMLVKQVAEGLAAGLTVVSLEDRVRFEVLGDMASAIRVQVPSARWLWQAWLHAGEATRAAWAAVPPQPIYLKPPHITAPKRSWLALS
ncbi:MAG: tRNA (adenosine(37)-N6)-threonylcarbamoyltransferase complex dimerization subunit type 1 TsaB [Akkermansiaceae bacterium]|nr:tRNA (adenosine(37)-N6)-threonylcarbamoyltransferase complex dimerization subunit type 1 TsaB [Akkermansiaceae bacterium]MCF7732803.1 tRNA (adenosine(37)-N6)-threonylcarbamoyltransferase complex dimerization subunit type 1 TsaB [Akkermansiaceae bacterium]